MRAQTGRIPAPPGALRPAQLGVVLIGRVLPIHIGATVVDLASRGFLSMQIAADDSSSWRLTISDRRPEDLLDCERTLLHGLFGRQPTIPWSTWPSGRSQFSKKYVPRSCAMRSIAGGYAPGWGGGSP